MVGRRYFNREAFNALLLIAASTAVASSRTMLGMRDILMSWGQGRRLKGTSAARVAAVEGARCLGIMCGACLPVCPTRALSIVDAGGLVHARMEDTLIGPRRAHPQGDPDLSRASRYWPFAPGGLRTVAAVAPPSADGMGGCIGCGLCVQACTVKAIRLEER